MYSLSDYAYHLPEERIAQAPAADRAASRLLRLDRAGGGVSRHRFADLPGLLRDGDVLVINDTAVVPARLIGRKETGGRVEALIIDYAPAPAFVSASASGNGAVGDASGAVAGTDTGTGAGEDKGTVDGRGPVYQCLLRASKRPRLGSRIIFDDQFSGVVMDVTDDICALRFECEGDFADHLERVGQVPLPPYIKRNGSPPPCDDPSRYQTVYARRKGAVAAPTAGLHFTPALMDRLRGAGIQIAAITLHVGHGTFAPVRATDIRTHRMHAERYAIPPETANLLNAARADGRRIVAVGTTCVRSLEFAAAAGAGHAAAGGGPIRSGAGHVAAGGGAAGGSPIRAGAGQCDLFIYPGYEFKAVDAMITNFHLPESTLLMLVAAFAGRERILSAYETAIAEGYRFYSYGDAMLIE